MTVLEKRDEFPVGMRVLAVDDDPICLKVLECMLIRCQYHVTITDQAIKAWEMLRENRDQFDLVISDVHMPDMDGYTLLELVGLEMDLPVIMLSANGETEAVMKGITHGACDYLLKPVRLEELKNIWQHVIRRKKIVPRDEDNFDRGEDCENVQPVKLEEAQGSLTNGSSNSKLDKKRKDQDEESEGDEDSLNESEDQSSHKKPRVVWAPELHQKFISAVEQLGVEKAVPKRILDLMNVEGLTRENVASHLQKFRLLLKKIEAGKNQDANIAATLRSQDLPYLSVGTLEGFGLPGLVPPRTFNNTISSIDGVGKLQPLQNHRQGTLLQGMHLSLEQDKLQQPKAIQEANNQCFNNFSGNLLAISRTANRFANAIKSSHVLQQTCQQTHSIGLSNQCLGRIPSLSADPFESGVGATRFSSSHNDLSSSPIGSRLQSQISSPIMMTGVGGDANSLSFGSSGNSNFEWEAPKQGLKNSHLTFNSMSNSSVSHFRVNDQNAGDDKLGVRYSNKMDESFWQDGFGSGGSSLEDIVGSALIKPETDDIVSLDTDIGCNDLFSSSFGACY